MHGQPRKPQRALDAAVATAKVSKHRDFQGKSLYETTDSEHIKSLVDDELKVVEMALRQNPKSYAAWYHRKWILSQGFVDVDFDREFGLLDQLFKADTRNFHGWRYRLWQN